ncbi:MAG: DUF559 domain-containing protein [Brevundimonas sp.]|uniref:endonuclease domain-containing protein n=1 Tax=Brevundimonas sp. TaxID=1871086 RepID=UPI002732FAA3|nr:DUF559 domain-containing protein [Brevundimonas sp.]MDP3378885.1 DUF559 domain-containing protein [Brevundimonas sp.]
MVERATVEKARALRRRLTPPEARLWAELRGGRLGGLRMRRQHPVGPFSLDVYCAAAKLAIEVDGLGHEDPDRARADTRRTGWLAEQGITVLRVTAEEVRTNLDGVLGLILETALRRVG